MIKEYDLLIIGGGPGGYVAAIRAAQLGFKVALVEENKVGGVCLHQGCIPSKTYIKSANLWKKISQAQQFGIQCDLASFSFSEIQQRANSIIKTLHGGVTNLLKKYNISVYKTRASLMGASIFSPLPGSVSVIKENIQSSSNETFEDENDILVGKYVILATGTSVRSLGDLKIDGKFILSSNEILQLDTLPKSIIIVGGGVIGIEWACVLNNLGCQVTILEYGEQITPTEDKDISLELKKLLIKQGIKIVNNVSVISESFKVVNNQATITALTKDDNATQEYTADKIMIAVGRIPNSQGIGLENTKIKLNAQGYVQVNKHFQTQEKHIFAIGDVTGLMPLAHFASASGVYVVEYLKGLQPSIINVNNVPKCIYSNPEVASVGLTEDQAKQQNFNIKTDKFPFLANPKALIEGKTEGFIKVIIDLDSNDLLGVHIIGCHATELISTASLAKFLDASGLELGKSIYPHPSISEIISEGALNVFDMAIHKH